MRDWGFTIHTHKNKQHLPPEFDFVWYCAEQQRLNILPSAAIANLDETATGQNMHGNWSNECSFSD